MVNNSFNPGQRRYYGPKDGKSRPKKCPRLTGVMTRAVSALVYKREVSGRENLPEDQGFVYSPNHENTFEPLTWLDLAKGDVRGMVDIGVFSNPVSATVARLGGAFPMDRHNPSPVTLEHSVEVIESGASEIIYPQGGFPDDDQIGGIFKGAAHAALEGGGKGIVPMGLHIEDSPKKKRNWKDALVGVALATAVGVAAVAGAPLLAGALAGGAVATIASGKLARKLVPQKHDFDPLPNIVSGLGGGFLGTAGGAAAGVAVAAIGAPVTLPLMAAAAVGGLTISHAARNRPTIKIDIQKPLLSSDYEVSPTGVSLLTADLHESLAQSKSRLSGVPIDRAIPIFATSAWQEPE